MKKKTGSKGRAIQFDRNKMKLLRRKGFTLSQIAKKLGCSIQTASLGSRLGAR